jgi:hypothetical protein
MKRSGWIKRKKGVNPQSDAGREYQEEFELNSQIVQARARYRCEIQTPHDCDGFISTVHHRKLRSQGGSNHPDNNLLAVCFTGHVWIHTQLPRYRAVLLQLITPSTADEHPYDPYGDPL